jgi:transcription elongation factor Elf1
MLCTAAPGYNLTFRCINCGRHEASASYPSDGVVREDQLKARIYQVNCAACGWKGEACGFAPIRISPVTELDRVAGR